MACVRACAYNPVTQIRYIFLLFSPKILGEGLDGPIEKAELGKGGKTEGKKTGFMSC